MSYQLQILDRIGALPEPAWAQARAQGHAFLTPAFLEALEATGCVDAATGWQPVHLVLWEDEAPVAWAPAYLKSHSRGEFVFDRAWAEAYLRHGLAYYPKLVVAMPFTPVTGPRLMAAEERHRLALAQALPQAAQALGASSVHVLFPQASDLQVLEQAGFMVREGVQFHWRNAGYADEAAFLAALTQDKRKKMRQDRKKVEAAGIRLRWLEGEAIDAQALDFFYRCYALTYDRHWGRPYLSPEFFAQWHARDPQRLLLVMAEREGGERVACALHVKGDDVLYGRYWGAVEFVPGLHFEACYAQGIAYCIAHGIRHFEGGAQGEHKMARGLTPVRTYSAHWLADPRFAHAVQDFLQQETQAVAGYVEELEASSPYRRTG